MEVKYNTSSQDIGVFLSEEEFEGLVKKLKNYHGNKFLRAFSQEAGMFFHLEYCADLGGFFRGADECDGGIQLKLTEEVDKDYYPHYINLKPEAVAILRREKGISSRYIGGAKLIIVIKEE